MDFVILNAGRGYRIKSYGPKCLLKLDDGQTILERQLRLISKKYKNAKFHNCIGFENYKILKNKAFKEYNISHTINEQFENTNNLYSLKCIVDTGAVDSGCFVMHGDIIFDENHLPERPKTTTLYTSQNSDKEKLGINCNNGIAHYIIWESESLNSWAEFCYLDPETIHLLKNYDCQNKEYLFEFLNILMDKGKEIKVEPFGSEVIDVDLLSDLELANAKFSISKV